MSGARGYGAVGLACLAIAAAWVLLRLYGHASRHVWNQSVVEAGVEVLFAALAVAAAIFPPWLALRGDVRAAILGAALMATTPLPFLVLATFATAVSAAEVAAFVGVVFSLALTSSVAVLAMRGTGLGGRRRGIWAAATQAACASLVILALPSMLEWVGP